MSPPKQDETTGARTIELEVGVAGTPEQAWTAIATGPGITAWFVPTTVEERDGGEIVFDLGDVESRGVVTAWEPPHRFGYEERDWSPGAPPLATELHVAARAGGRCAIRLVHRLFTERHDWDDHLAGFEKGWPPYFRVLQLYLEHFAGEPAATVRVTGHPPGPDAAAWSALTAALGLGGLAIGDRATTAPGGPALAGVVERTGEGDLLLRLERPAPGVAILAAHSWAGEVYAMVQLFFYGAGAAAAAAEAEPAWRRWMDAHVRETTGREA